MTMVLPKYKPNFDGLTTEQAHYLASAMELPERDTLSGSDIYEVANELRMDQADVVMTLADDPTVLGVDVIEALVGKPIVRRRKAEHVARTKGVRRSVTVRREDTRRIARVADNPKKPGSASHMRFALYRVGMTVSEFLAAGGTMGDVKWDAERGFIEFGDAPEAQA